MSAGRDLLGEHCFRINDTFVKMEHGLEGEVLFECKPLADQRFNLGCTSPEGCKDELDNVLLSVRLEILLQKIHQRRCSKEKIGVEKCSGGKRKWEVPIEIALKEDAPGLLEKLQERGLLTDISIYDTFVEDDYMNIDDHFKSLEEIARKIWGTTSTLFKQPPVLRQHVSALGKDPSYCLSCLVSLIDQAKSMKQRNWPVEWGWCRELRAFIFVFDKHNRIVLERPEYGNATYFFELVQFLPVRWQVLRLIHVLGVIALGKTALLENKPLEVGYELTDEESKVLESFGWTPGTGLGSFLNFCDRVFHEAKEEANMEWRQKIGKCLMDGYDKGRIMAPTLPPILRHFIVTKTEPYIKAQ
ncbi:hypothetical protein KP509_10G052500 [Ceratopteris richardii]|nr:hypothetical protein KP509_10G052500 [Ceratopteris richardii]